MGPPVCTHSEDGRLGGEAVGQLLQLRHAVRQPHRQLLVQKLRRHQQVALRRVRPAADRRCCDGTGAGGLLSSRPTRAPQGSWLTKDWQG